MVQRFYNQRRQNILNASPNLAHQLIAQLENRYDVQIITQNIDDLHERAGSSSVLHLHGNIRLAKSFGPNAQYTAEFYPIQGAALDLEKDKCPAGYALRPHVVWFGEAVPAYAEASALAQQAEIFIVIGTSLAVYPVAGLVHEIPPACQAYYIDPKADYAHVPKQYRLIQQTAAQGMQILFDRLMA